MSNKTMEPAQQLAQDILKLSFSLLRVRLRFLDLALSGLRPHQAPGASLLTDGSRLYYGAAHVLRRYKAGQEQVARELLHLVLHCVLRHMFVGAVAPELWDLACDMAVEEIILELGLFSGPEDALRRIELEGAGPDSGCLTAERLYRQLREHPPAPERLEELARLFQADSHRLWYRREAASPSSKPGVQRQELDFGRDDGQAEARWRLLGQRMQVELETISPRWGSSSASLVQSLGQLNRRRYDYAAFLKKFAVSGEVLKVSDDGFDPIFYTYGLALYGNLPLVEPLEYRELRLIREFVVAVDTSASVEGTLVQKFIQRTYEILQSTESFFSRVNLHLLLCDAEIQEDIKITCQQDLERCMAGLSLRGFGGTDFRPVFAYVDNLIRQGEFANLKGLLYFTDGYGTFPSQKPAYDAAFVFLGQRHPQLPPWAIQLVLEEEELAAEPSSGVY